jgi:uncharacterized membrane protein YidH (DUF202 family)
MTALQLGLLVVGVALSQVALALLYLRPKAASAPPGSRYVLWRPLLVLATLALAIGIAMLILPEHLWFSP